MMGLIQRERVLVGLDEKSAGFKLWNRIDARLIAFPLQEFII
jgi:hypothetical protein